MEKSQLRTPKTPARTRRVIVSRRSAGAAPTPTNELPMKQLRPLAHSWLLDGQARGHTERTEEMNAFIIEKFIWWAERTDEGGKAIAPPERIGPDEIRAFISYLRGSHELPEGRWRDYADIGKPLGRKGHLAYQPISKRTLLNYWRALRVFFAWCVTDGVLSASPFANLQQPMHRPDQINPMNEQQILALIEAAKRSRYRYRDTAILYMLLDTGIRVSEMAGLTYGDLDMNNRKGTVLGKGDKRRSIYWSPETGRVLYAYFHKSGGRDAPDEPVFAAENGISVGCALTRVGIYRVIKGLGDAAGVKDVRCSPHTLRHTFSVMMLRNGGNQFQLKDALGHTSLAPTARYVKLAEVDRAEAARLTSPVSGLKKKKNNRT